MSLRLGRGFGRLAEAALAVVLAATLAAAMAALFPAAAGAQTQDGGARSAVVRPGDTLWSISAERLGPGASPRRVMNGAERIHALNRARIGADSNLVLVGQVLSIPRAMSGTPAVETPPAREAAEAAGEGTPRRAPGQGAIPRPEATPEDAAKTLESDTGGKGALPDPRAVAPVPAVRMAASNDAQPWSLLGVPKVAAPTPVAAILGGGVLLAAFLAAYGRHAARRKARERELRFRETYGRPYDAPDPPAIHGRASRWASEVRGQTPPPDGPTNAGAAPEDRSNRTGPAAVARAKRARILRRRPPDVQRRSPRLRARGARQPVRTRPRGGASSGHGEWEPDAALVGALGGLPLRPGTGIGDDLARLEPQLKEALEALGRLERRRGLSESEKTRSGALMTLMAAIERAG